MRAKEFSCINAAYPAFLEELLTNGETVQAISDPTSVGSGFGASTRSTREILGYSFVIHRPVDRALYIPSRRINLPFAIANSIWTMAGSDSLEFINLYNERGSHFSDDQITLHGAHGKRLINSDGINQLKAVTDKIKQDPYSRRTVATIYHPRDNQVVSRDIPCPIALQFLQRGGKLHALTYMRSQSAAMVLPYDTFAFSFIQEALAVYLGLGVGSYHHISGSFHYYLDEEELVERIAREGYDSTGHTALNVPEMPISVDPFEMVEEVLQLEEQMREHMRSSTEAFIIPDKLPRYWSDLALVLAVKLAKMFGRNSQTYLSQLPVYYLRFFE